MLGGIDGSVTLPTYRAQLFASRYAIPIDTAALVAALALGGCNV